MRAATVATSAPALLTTEDMTRLLSCNRTTIHNHLVKGVLPVKPFKIGNRVYWKASEIDAWLSSLANDANQGVL